LIAEEFEARHPSVSWEAFRKLGNRYRHEYDGIDLFIVWGDLGLEGLITQVEDAMKAEIALAQIPASHEEDP
jgi:uncharacterized protein with HEPN domain